MRTIAMVVMGEFTRSSNRQEYLKRSLGEPLAKRATVRRSFLIALYRVATLRLFLNYRGLWGERWGSRGGHVERFVNRFQQQTRRHAMWEYMRFE